MKKPLKHGDRTREEQSTRVHPKISGLAAWSENCKW